MRRVQTRYWKCLEWLYRSHGGSIFDNYDLKKAAECIALARSAKGQVKDILISTAHYHLDNYERPLFEGGLY